MCSSDLKNLNALEGYNPRSYSGHVVMLRASEVSPNMRATAGDLCDDPAFGWQSCCTAPVTVRWVPGDHARMNMEPNVRVVGAELQRSIEEILESRFEYHNGHARSARATG